MAVSLAIGPATVALAQSVDQSKIGAPFLWKITGAKTPSWIFGTIHLARPDVATPPAALTKALDEADAVFTEIPMDPTTMLAIAPRLLLPPGQSLRGLLGPARTAALESEFPSRTKGMATAAYFDRLKPWAAAVTLLEGGDQAKYPGTLALDVVLFQRAVMAGKTVGGLETPDEQLGIFEKLSDEEQIALLEDTVTQIRAHRARGENVSDSLSALYLAGDLDALVTELNRLDTAGNHPDLSEKLMDRLLYRRNAVMAARIVQKLRDQPDKSFLFAVGAAHLQGDRGLIAALEKAGFHLERVALSSPPTPHSQLP